MKWKHETTRRRGDKKRKVLSWVAAFLMVTTLFSSQFAAAAAGQEPPHTKHITDNQDGTYTLSLDVVGDSEKKIQKVNVIVIVDRSNSMDTQSGTGAYIPTSSFP